MLPVATLQQFGDGRAAAVEREPARRDPEDARRVDCVEKRWRGLDLHVGSGRLSIEDDRRILWRVEFGERQRCFQGRMGGDEARVDIERVPQGIGDVPAELVVADACRERDGMTVAGGGDGDVRGRSADGLPEGRDVGHRHAGLFGVEVDAHPSDREKIERRHRRSASSTLQVDLGRMGVRLSTARATGGLLDRAVRRRDPVHEFWAWAISCCSASSSAPPAISEVSSFWLMSSLAKLPIDWPRLRITKRSPTG